MRSLTYDTSSNSTRLPYRDGAESYTQVQFQLIRRESEAARCTGSSFEQFPVKPGSRAQSALHLDHLTISNSIQYTKE